MGAKNKNEPSRSLLNFQTALKRGAIHNRKIPRHKKWVLEWVNSMCQVGPDEHARITTIQKMQNRLVEQNRFKFV